MAAVPRAGSCRRAHAIEVTRLKPWELLGEARTPDGTDLTLTRHDREFVIMANGKSLMSSRMHGSEQALASLALRGLRVANAHVLVGGLGMGFTLRATLDLLREDATIVLAELVPAVVEWNRGALGPLAGDPLRDPRVRVELGDVAETLQASRNRFDAVLLDVDNGPDAFTATTNARLYGDSGLAAAHGALKDRGVLAVWSAWEDRRFEQRLRHAGFTVHVERVRGRLKKGGPKHTIFVASKASAATLNPEP
jgi:spermidine synthase